MSPPSGALHGRHYLAIALVSAAVLVLEIGITRILSVVLWYHFAFLSISLAMLGLGAPGVWFAVRKPSERALPAALLLSGALLPASIIAIFKLGRPLKHLGIQFPSLTRALDPTILLIVAAVLIPMLCLGTAITLLILHAPRRELGRMYGADLLGATAGSIAVIALLGAMPTPVLVAGAGILPLVAAALLAPRVRLAATALAAAIVGLAVWGKPFQLEYTKQYAERQRVIFERWTPTARITIFPYPFFAERPEHAFGWGFGTRYQHRPIEQLWIEQDGSAGTPITRLYDRPDPSRGRLGEDHPDLGHLLYDVTSVGYQVTPARRVCVIGAGGGRDVLTALLTGAAAVDAVELNPAIPRALATEFRLFSGDPYHLPGVREVIAEGRSFLTRTPHDYDMLQISLIDSWAATASGAFALSENYLYTVEALRLYWRRLSPRGMASLSRWSLGEHEHEIVRLAPLARRALELEGVARPNDHVAVASARGVSTVLVTRAPIDSAWMGRFDEVCRERGFARDWPLYDDEQVSTMTARIMAASHAPARWIDVRPTTDDRPFFFQTVPVFGPVEADRLSKMSPNENSVLLLRTLMVWITGLALVLFLTPLPFAGARGGAGDLLHGGLYFVLIGLGFMFVESPWVQRFILYLGHPSYAAGVVLATMLLAAGLGSLTAARLELGTSRRLLLMLPLALALLNAVMTPVFEVSVGTPFALRVAISVLLLAPGGFLMGFALPVGMARFHEANRAGFWAMNGIASVVGTVLALAFSMVFGLRAVAFAGAALYLLAWMVLSLGRRDEAATAATA